MNEQDKEQGLKKTTQALVDEGFAIIIELIRAEEREACAKVCDSADKSTHPADLANAIRARGNT